MSNCKFFVWCSSYDLHRVRQAGKRQMTFAGFPKGLVGYLQDLGKHNDKLWFEDHRADYEANYTGPALDFITAFAPIAEAFDPPLKSQPKINGSLRRIHRDTRFSKDKTPYHTRLHMIFWAGDHPTRSPGLHVVISKDGFGCGAGHWGFDKDQLERYRTALGDPKAVTALRKAIKTAQADGNLLDEPHLAKVPRGFDADGKNADLLRYKGLVMRADSIHPDALFGKKAIDHISKRANALMPLNRWLTRTVFT